jgi:hypothetical protein
VSSNSTGEKCENFIKSISDVLVENQHYSLIENGVELERGLVSINLLNRRLLAISTHRNGEARSVFFIGKESSGDENSYVYSMVNQRNKIFSSVSREGKRQQGSCLVNFKILVEEDLMNIELSSDKSDPHLLFALEDESYIKYNFHK